MTTIVEQALAHVEMGFRVCRLFGTKPSGECRCPGNHKARLSGDHKPGKHPMSPHGFKDSTSDPDVIRDWLTDGESNYGISRPADDSDEVFIIDVDEGGPPWEARWAQTQAETAPLTETKTTTTRNGLHVFLRWHPAYGPRPSGKWRGYVVRWPDRGYVVGPGSTVGDFIYTDNGKPIALVPEAVALDMVKPKADTAAPAGKKVKAGGRHDHLVRTARFFRGRLSGEALFQAVWAVNLTDCEPPKDEAAVRRAIGDVERKFAPDLIHVTDEDDEDWIQHYGVDIELDDSVNDAAFIGPVGTFAAEVGGTTSLAPALGLLGTILVLTSGQLCAGPTVARGGLPTRTNAFGMVIGGTGDGKGACVELGQAAFSHDSLFSPERILTSTNSGEGLVRRLIDLDTVEDGSTPAVAITEEFTKVIRQKNRDAASLGQYMREAYDGRRLDRNLSKRSDSGAVEKPVLAWLGNVTPGDLGREASYGDAADGFLNRFFFIPVVEVDRSMVRLEEFPDHRLAELGDALHEVIGWARSTRTMRYAAEAYPILDRVDAWAHEAGREPGLVGKMSKRTTENVLRLAKLYAITEMDDVIRERHVLAAVALISVSGHTIRNLWAMRPSDPSVATMLEKVKRAGPAGASVTDLLHGARAGYRDRLKWKLGRATDEGLFRRVKAEGLKGWRIVLGSQDGLPDLWEYVTGAKGTPPRGKGDSHMSRTTGTTDGPVSPLPHDRVPVADHPCAWPGCLLAGIRSWGEMSYCSEHLAAWQRFVARQQASGDDDAALSGTSGTPTTPREVDPVQLARPAWTTGSGESTVETTHVEYCENYLGHRDHHRNVGGSWVCDLCSDTAS